MKFVTNKKTATVAFAIAFLALILVLRIVPNQTTTTASKPITSITPTISAIYHPTSNSLNVKQLDLGELLQELLPTTQAEYVGNFETWAAFCFYIGIPSEEAANMFIQMMEESIVSGDIPITMITALMNVAYAYLGIQNFFSFSWL